MESSQKKNVKIAIIVLVVVLVLVGISLGIYYGMSGSSDSSSSESDSSAVEGSAAFAKNQRRRRHARYGALGSNPRRSHEQNEITDVVPGSNGEGTLPMSFAGSFPDTVTDPYLAVMPTSMATTTSSLQGNKGAKASMMPASDSLYMQDPSTMTQPAPSDAKSVDDYMPSLSGATADGKDPETGLRLVTLEGLKKANRLGGYGLHGYLRPVLDPFHGLRRQRGNHVYREGRSLENEAEKRREQLKAAQAQANGVDPVLWNSSEFQLT